MGKQIQIATTYEDELLFLQFLIEHVDVALLESFPQPKRGSGKNLLNSN
jgi:hypothetical protein